MAAASDTATLPEKFENLDLSRRDSHSADPEPPQDDPDHDLPLADVYKLALNFYKGNRQKKTATATTKLTPSLTPEKEGKAVHFSYEDKLQLVAFSQQILHGPFADAVSKLPPLGALDVVGRDRRLAWQRLGGLSADQARSGFIELLSRKCPLFEAYVEAHRMEKREQERLA